MRRAAAMVLASVSLLAGCASAKPAGPDDKHATLLQRGTLDGVAWQLTAFRNAEGNLCFDARRTRPAPGTDPDLEAGCGFGPPDDHLADDVDSASADGPDTLFYGPTPVGATRVVLTSRTEPATKSHGNSVSSAGCRAAVPARVAIAIPARHRLPAWAGPGGWFVTTVPTGTGCDYEFDAFYDAAGKQVTNHRW